MSTEQGKILVIKCTRCKKKIFKYRKIGKGKLWHCWKDRILEDYGIRSGNKIQCRCGNTVGIDQEKWIKIYPVRCIIVR